MLSYIFIAAIAFIGLLATFAVGISKANQTEGSQYSNKTKGNILRLTLLNALYVVILVVVFLVYIRYFQ
ncbi:small-conductance mechanosensitive channel [Bacillus sp. 3255]|nr:small-conductance mechanosensitive channel [Bacillus sp. 3255]